MEQTPCVHCNHPATWYYEWKHRQSDSYVLVMCCDHCLKINLKFISSSEIKNVSRLQPGTAEQVREAFYEKLWQESNEKYEVDQLTKGVEKM